MDTTRLFLLVLKPTFMGVIFSYCLPTSANPNIPNGDYFHAYQSDYGFTVKNGRYSQIQIDEDKPYPWESTSNLKKIRNDTILINRQYFCSKVSLDKLAKKKSITNLDRVSCTKNGWIR